MNRRMFAKALASVAGALKAKEVIAQSTPAPLDLTDKGLPLPPDWLSEPEPLEVPGPSAATRLPTINFLGKGWRRSPTDPPLTLAEQADLWQSGRNKSHDNSYRFTLCSAHCSTQTKIPQ